MSKWWYLESNEHYLIKMKIIIVIMSVLRTLQFKVKVIFVRMNFRRKSVRLDLNFVIRSHINNYIDILYCTGTGSNIPKMIYKILINFKYQFYQYCSRGILPKAQYCTVFLTIFPLKLFTNIRLTVPKKLKVD